MTTLLGKAYVVAIGALAVYGDDCFERLLLDVGDYILECGVVALEYLVDVW